MRCPNCGWINANGQSNCEKCATALQSGNPPAAPEASRGSAAASSIVSATAMGLPANTPAWDEPANPPIPPVQPQPLSPLPNVNRKKPEIGKKDMLLCPNRECGYKNTNTANYCVACGTSLSDASKMDSNATLLAEEESSQKHQTNRQLTGHKPNAIPPSNNPRPVTPNLNATVNPWSQRKNPGFKLRPVPREGEQLKAELEFEGVTVDLSRSNLEPSNTTITSKNQALIEYRDGAWFITNKSNMNTTFIRVDGALPIKKGDVLLLGDRLFEFDC